MNKEEEMRKRILELESENARLRSLFLSPSPALSRGGSAEPPRFLFCFDKFKDSMSGSAAGEAALRGVRRHLGAASGRVLALSDGGGGFLDVLCPALGLRRERLSVCSPLGPSQPTVSAEFGCSEDGRLGVFEMCSASGLALVPPALRDARRTTSFGSGQLLAHLWARGVREVLLGVGGSATVDAGVGMLQALGVRFVLDCGEVRDASAPPLTGADLPRIVSVESPFSPLSKGPSPHEKEGDPEGARPAMLTIACDVRTPLENVALYAAQKCVGAGAEAEAAQAELCDGVRALSTRWAALGALTAAPFGGAAGGMAAGLRAALGVDRCHLADGARVIADAVALDEAVEACDVVVTGEGRVDQQTGEGKVVEQVVRTARKHGKRVVVVAGAAEGTMPDAMVIMSAVVGKERSMAEPEAVLEEVVARNIPLLF